MSENNVENGGRRRPADAGLQPSPVTARPSTAMHETDRPTIVIVDDEERARDVLVASLRRRFGTDYEVLAPSGPAAAFAELVRLRDQGADAALILASQWMTAEAGTAFLARTRDVYPTARRLLVTGWADLSAMQPVARASTLGEIDFYATRPSNETDEQFLATIGDILAEWARENGHYVPAITIVGERWDAESQSLGDVLQRWGAPLRFVEVASPEGAALVAEHGMDGDLPVVVLPDGRALARPTVSDVAEAFGANAEPLSTVFDVAILGSGPAGLSAAVNAASEGLRVLVVEPSIGQASSSPMVRNYLGFPAGVSGAELVRRAWQQAWLFGAQARMGRGARGIRADGDERIVLLDDGSEARARAIVLATGASYRRIGIPSVEGLIGHGVFYGSGATEAQAMAGESVAVVGGGNSAAQSAIHLARYAGRVSVLVRGPSLAGSVSEYLIDQLNDLANVDVHLNAEILEARDGDRLRSLLIRDNAAGAILELEAMGLFLLIGAEPHTEWLPAGVARDERGFVLTGDDAPSAVDRGRVRLPFETTMPGVFAAGDVRHGSIKRVAAAVGEGATASQQVQRYRFEASHPEKATR